MQPTTRLLIAGELIAVAVRDEIFAPVVTTTRFSDVDQAVDRARTAGMPRQAMIGPPRSPR